MPVSSKEFLDIQANIECGFSLKCIRDMIITYSQYKGFSRFFCVEVLTHVVLLISDQTFGPSIWSFVVLLLCSLLCQIEAQLYKFFKITIYLCVGWMVQSGAPSFLFVNCFYLNVLEKVRNFDQECHDKVMNCQDKAFCSLSGNPVHPYIHTNM